MSALSSHLTTLRDALAHHTHARDLAEQLIAVLSDTGRARALWIQLSTELNQLGWAPPDDVRAAVLQLDAALGDAPDLRAILAPLSSSNSTDATNAVARQEQFQFAALLHALAVRPAQVLPPGKGILSLLARPRNGDQYAGNPVASQIAEGITRAFFDSIAEALTTPDSAAQIARLNQLYQDLHIAFTDVLPPHIPEMHTLATPITSSNSLSPLETARSDLQALLRACKRRAAPVRDSAIDGLLQQLSAPPADLARTVTDAIRGALKLGEDMKHDMIAFASSRWRESDVRLWLRAEATVHEKAAILALSSAASVQRLWDIWLSGQPPRDSVLAQWVARLTLAIGQNTPVQIQLNADDAQTNGMQPHVLPPHFAFSTGEVVRVQNLVQALVVVAALLALVPGHSGTTTPTSDAAEPQPASLSSRLWTLLSTEIDPNSGGGTTLTDLRAEIQRANPRADPKSIDRILRYEDPVFALLQKRILAALESSVPTAVQRYRAQRAAAPLRLLSGRGRGANASDNAVTLDVTVPVEVPVVKGLEDDTLRKGVTSCAQELARAVLWITDVWGSEVL